MLFLQETTHENVEVLTEAGKDGSKKYFIEGPFLQANIVNRNNRKYPLDTMVKEVKKYNEQFVKQNRALGELGHPDNPQINLERASHLITKLEQEGNNFVGKAKVLDTPYGKIVQNLIDGGAKLGVSSRALGSLKECSKGIKEVQKDFRLITAGDIVADPSAPDAFVDAVMEGMEWVWDNGVIHEVKIEEYKKEIAEATQRTLDFKKIEIFGQFMIDIHKKDISNI